MFNESLAHFLDHLKYERSVSDHTIRNYTSDLEQFRDFLLKVERRDDFPVENIDRLTIREWMASLHSEKKKKTSVARKLASLRTFFQFLIREGKIDNNPAKMVATPPWVRSRYRAPASASRRTKSSAAASLLQPA